MRPTPVDPATHAPDVDRIINLPNALTGFRLACVPVLIVLLCLPAGPDGLPRDAAALVFVVASITDILDGVIARRRGLVTTFGKIADPIADKALTGTALIGLSVLGELSWWVTAVILIREVGITAVRFWVIEHGIIAASRGGKVKTVLQTIAITMYLLVLPASIATAPALAWWGPVRATVMGVAVVLTVVTGIDYLVRALRLRSRSQPPARS